MNERDYARAAEAFGEGRHLDALTVLNRLLAGNSSPLPAALLGETLEALGLKAEAAEAFETAVRLGHANGVELLRRTMLLYFENGNGDQAQLLGLKLFSVVPEDVDVAYVLATLFRQAGEAELVDLVKNILVDSDDPRHLDLALELIGDEERNPATVTLFRKLSASRPDDHFALLKYMSVARNFCDYDAIERLEAIVHERIAAGVPTVLEGETGYSNLLHCADERLNRFARNNVQPPFVPLAELAQRRHRRPHRWGERLKIGYLSNDFRPNHATMRLLQRVLECHDPDRVDVTLYCYTATEDMPISDDTSRTRWGRIVSIGAMSDELAAEQIRSDCIDILVDLKGHTGGSRSRLLNLQLAPVHVAWLGFPGSVVDIDSDYVIGDPIVLPESSKPHYHETFCRLPECYQPNDPVHRPMLPAPARSELGLPADRFVFGAFNIQRKISLQTLKLWSAVLRRSGDAVLWVHVYGDLARNNFLKRMEKLGISQERIVFAPKVPNDEHLTRLRAADLGLDTVPYNGHTTTSDKLWAGLPVVTIKGSNFASRVSESLLTAVGLPELVAETDEAFVDLAVNLSNNPQRVAALKAHLDANRLVAPLFDAERFCRHLEMAYAMMAERARAGLAPELFDVPALPKRVDPFQSC